VNHTARIGRLRRKLTKEKISGLLVTQLHDLRYLSGFTGSSAALAVTPAPPASSPMAATSLRPPKR